MNKVLETQRLYLRELFLDDTDDLAKIFMDKESMKYYPRPFSRQEVINWIKWCRKNYLQYGHGLWAVVLKQGDVFLGDCGITMQDIDGERLPELGYHIKKEYCNMGFATEAAEKCIDYALKVLKLKKLYLYTKTDNNPSRHVAEKIGFKFVREFEKTVMSEEIVTEALYCYYI